MDIHIYAHSPECIVCGASATHEAVWTARNGNSVGADVCEAHAKEYRAVGAKTRAKARRAA